MKKFLINIRYYFWKNPKRIILNFWRFRKEISGFRDFDYHYNFSLFNKSLEITANAIDKRELIMSHKEVHDEIKRLIELYDRLCNDTLYFEEAGGDWCKIKFDVVDNKLIDKKEYSQNAYDEIRKNGKKLYEKDLEEFGELIKKFPKWWD